MLKKLAVATFVVFLVLASTAVAQQRTKVTSNYAKRLLLGRHMLSLQWISWDYYGRAYARQRRGVVTLKGQQKSRENDDYLKIDGVVTEINRYNFKLSRLWEPSMLRS